MKSLLSTVAMLAAFAITSTQAIASSPSSTVNVTPAGAATIKQAIESQRGHVVVVNFWATWCDPCVAEFPDLVKFSRDYAKQGVVVYAVSADMRKDIDTKVKPFLASKHATFRQFLQVSTDPEDFINAFDPKWQGDLPRTFVYDKSGKLITELSGAHTEKEFAAAVDPLLK